MSVLRLLTLLVLAIWIGGLAALGGVAAPAVFSVLQDLDPVAGRETAGRVFGAIFVRFQYLSWMLALLLMALLGTRAALGPRPRRFGWRMWVTSGMLAVSVAAGLYIAPRIDAIRDEVHGTVQALPDDDARKVEFGRLHGLSNGLMLATVIAGVWLVWIELRDKH
jgi:MFS family permease